MQQIDRPDSVSPDRVIELSQEYESCLPESLKELHTICRSQIPQTLATRSMETELYLSKSEVTSLLMWKLKHGKHRPTLPSLVASNSEKDVKDITKEAFATYRSSQIDFINPSKSTDTVKCVQKIIDILAKLRGIGPATASLILSRLDPQNVPFFSDELFRYLHFEPESHGPANLKARPGKGWDRKISYSKSDYGSILEKLAAMRRRWSEDDSSNEISAEYVEKAAYVLFRKYSQQPASQTVSNGHGTAADAQKSKKDAPKKRAREAKAEAEADVDEETSNTSIAKRTRRSTTRGKT